VAVGEQLSSLGEVKQAPWFPPIEATKASKTKRIESRATIESTYMRIGMDFSKRSMILG